MSISKSRSICFYSFVSSMGKAIVSSQLKAGLLSRVVFDHFPEYVEQDMGHR